MTTASVGQAKICKYFGLSLSAAVLLVSNETMLGAAGQLCQCTCCTSQPALMALLSMLC